MADEAGRRDEGGGGSTTGGAVRAPDPYERDYMRGAGAVLHREKTVWKLHWLLLIGPLITLVVAAMGFAGLGSKPMPLPVAIGLLPLAAALVALWALFIALRVTVTSREVVVQYGLFGPRIPLDGIASCEVRDYPQLALGGGIKRVAGAWAYTLWGQGTRAVRIEWRDARGRKHATILSSPDPDALAATIQLARGAAMTNVRIDAAGGTDAAAEAARAEAEAEAGATERGEPRRARRD
ncbi:MAG: hypothetical protein HY908_24535 [Myxococcales bacterium]|nr:hypothetical protein [Myxococcales bacterium]